MKVESKKTYYNTLLQKVYLEFEVLMLMRGLSDTRQTM